MEEELVIRDGKSDRIDSGIGRYHHRAVTRDADVIDVVGRLYLELCDICQGTDVFELS